METNNSNSYQSVLQLIRDGATAAEVEEILTDDRTPLTDAQIADLRQALDEVVMGAAAYAAAHRFAEFDAAAAAAQTLADANGAPVAIYGEPGVYRIDETPPRDDGEIPVAIVDPTEEESTWIQSAEELPSIEIIEVEEMQVMATGATMRITARVGGTVCAWYAWQPHGGAMAPSGDSLDCWVPPEFIDHPRAAEIGFDVIAAAASGDVP